MTTNIEIKAQIRNSDRLKQIIMTIIKEPSEVLEQEDIFFNSPFGKLKLRVCKAGHSELIFYQRSDEKGPKQSKYAISRIVDPESLKAVLSSALGVRGVVKKRRVFYKFGQMRIHLDDVEGLGYFVEVEFVMRPGQDIAEGVEAVQSMMERLEIRDGDLEVGAYFDLLNS